ncbi:hypothetical protein UY3_05594 [Chelonia mydas]|uniref:Uncharacterized protein n=1 Tax=Chelonia mydas TaxID=8469 RepID=M7BJ40_CHEMY|nr:hypothetical protein UY3_05594 [Chelonia mydas]
MGAVGSGAGQGMCWMPFPQPPLAWSSEPRPMRTAIGRTCGRSRLTGFRWEGYDRYRGSGGSDSCSGRHKEDDWMWKLRYVHDPGGGTCVLELPVTQLLAQLYYHT